MLTIIKKMNNKRIKSIFSLKYYKINNEIRKNK